MPAKLDFAIIDSKEWVFSAFRPRLWLRYLTASDAGFLEDPHIFHCIICFMLRGIRICSGVTSDLMFLKISSNSCPLNLLLVRNHLAELIIINRLVYKRSNVTRVRVEPISRNQNRRKKRRLHFLGHVAYDSLCVLGALKK